MRFLLAIMAALAGWSQLIATAFAAPRLAFQTFAVRDLCEKDFAGTLKAARAMGFEGVETGRLFGCDAKALKAACDEAGLELVALQLYPKDLTEPQLAETIRFCKECGSTRINIAWFRGAKGSANDWQLIVNILNHAAEVCARHGITVAYHNHGHEFEERIAGMRTMEWLYDGSGEGLLKQVNPSERFSPLVKQELDAGWCVLAGADPVEWIKAHPGCNPTVHIMPAGNCAVGEEGDKADWKRIVPALVADGVEWLVVKPTARPDTLDDLKASIGYIKGIM